jgi:hypothetical protein
MGYLISILALAVMCALWAACQLWRNNGVPEREEDFDACCSSCPQKCDQARPSVSASIKVLKTPRK